jgi:hypothetical protein
MTATAPAPTAVPESAPRSRAVREIAVFLTTTFGLTAVSTGVALAEHVDVSRIDDASVVGQIAMYGQAFFPLVGALVARATTPRAERTRLGFRRPPARSIGIAWAIGLGYVVVAAALAWLTGLAGFSTADALPIVPLGVTLLVLPYIPLAIGEDVGWRGLFVVRLAQLAGPRAVVLVSGVVWSMFHWPLMLLLGGVPQDTAAWFSVAMFTISTAALGAVLASMQLRWGIWPGIVLHAVGNAALYHVVGPLTVTRPGSGYFAGEVGLFDAVVLVLVALAWWRFAPLRRTPAGTTEVG